MRTVCLVLIFFMLSIPACYVFFPAEAQRAGLDTPRVVSDPIDFPDVFNDHMGGDSA